MRASTDAVTNFAIRLMLLAYVAVIGGVFASAIFGCGPLHGGGWRFDWRGHAPIPGAARAVEIILDRAPCQPRGGWYGGRVQFYDAPFYCGGTPDPILVNGCMPAGYTLALFAVGYRAPLSDGTLPDEIGHYVFVSCGRGLGEDARGAYTPEFAAWLDGVRAAMRSEGL